MSREIAKKYLSEIKETLNRPSKDAAAWDAMSAGDRALLVRSAALNLETRSFTWQQIPAANQQKIRAAAKRAAAWVNQLELV